MKNNTGKNVPLHFSVTKCFGIIQNAMNFINPVVWTTHIHGNMDASIRFETNVVTVLGTAW